MGLFSKKHHDEPVHTGATGLTGTHHETSGTGLTGAGHRDHHTGTGAMGTGIGHSADRDFAHEGSNTGGLTGHHDGTTHGTSHGTGALGGRHEPGYGANDTTVGVGHHGPGHRGVGQETYGEAPAVAPGSTNYAQGGTARGAATSGGGSAKALEGKIEKGLGSLVGSTTLKAKGMEKEREAEMLKIQAAELEHAEGLESQARQARERAVASGADPHHRHLGGANLAGDNSTVLGDQMGHQPGFGPGTGGNPVLGGVGQARGSAL